MSPTFQDGQTTTEEKVTKILSNMSLKEKLGQLLQLDANTDLEFAIEHMKVGSFLNLTQKEIEEVQRLSEKISLKIPILQAVDAVHGHCFIDGATVFPTALAMSCSWDVDMIKKVGEITAKEMRSTGFHWNYTPNLDIARDPRWGRVNETFGEDKYLVGSMGRAMVEGLQNSESPVLACIKHFAAYGESVGGRDSAESEVSERKLRSIFLPAFKKSIDTGVKTIMTAYQAIDGVPCTINKLLLRNILFEEWGFEGIVITDYDNIGKLHREQYIVDSEYEASIATVNSGNHVIMATPNFIDHMIKAIAEGRVKIDTIDEHVSRVLKIKIELGLLNQKKSRNNVEAIKNQFGRVEHMAYACQVAEESIVLLKNNNRILPILDPSSKIAIIGPNADNRVAQLGDWGIRDNFGKHDRDMNSDHETNLISILVGIQGYYKHAEHHYGCTVDTNEENIDEAIEVAKQGDYVIAVVGDNLGLNGEVKDRATLDLPGMQLELLKALKTTGKTLIVILINGKPLILNWIDENADAIIETFNPGIHGGKAVTNIISGKINPSGKLTMSFPRHVGQLPVYYNQIPGWHGNSNGTGTYVDYTHKPLYPFGFGLSYSEFEFKDLQVTPVIQKIGKPIEVTITVINVSDIDGKEVIQVYFNDNYSSVTTPSKSLIGFKKISIKARESRKISFVFDSHEFSFIDMTMRSVIEPGDFTILVGNSSDDDHLLKTQFTFIK